ncbi:uncharacterized protein BO87DRAFT_395838 [Aspergillus neoniger CBS 115656]|uniref:Uncharacterized protein n=1 Tax=Aspergillus neoniger (strain CBS 115656) TaxID=1448310 RepID=A0A318ZIE8_ASPNB|nr:hypothetical protein BO87DRAFT_395838 [Aspergillus neoniger CBS 115656]PYH35792.1 hypothetical protein BO87DRAFT_395838 [Aspergillus neoniger CBS 115656]
MSHPINKFQPFPNFYVYRPGYMVVPLIPLDELPSWIQVGNFDWGDSSLYEAMLPASFNCFPRIGEYDIICHHCYKNVDSYHRSVSERSDSNASSRASDLPKGLAAQLPANSILLDPSFKLEQPPFGASLNVSPFVGLCFSSRKRLCELLCPCLRCTQNGQDQQNDQNQENEHSEHSEHSGHSEHEEHSEHSEHEEQSEHEDQSAHDPPGHPPPANTPEYPLVNNPADSPNPPANPPLNSPPESPDHSNPSLPEEEGIPLVTMSHLDQGHRASQASQAAQAAQAFQENGTRRTRWDIRDSIRAEARDRSASETAITESSSIHAVPITGTDPPAEAEQEGEAPPRNHVNGVTPVDTPGYAASASTSVEHTQPQTNGGSEAPTSGGSGNGSFGRRRARHRDRLNRRGQLFEDDMSAPETGIDRIDSVVAGLSGILVETDVIQPRQDGQRQNHKDQIRSDLERGVETPDHILGETCMRQGSIPEGVDGDAEDEGAEDHPEAGDDDEDEGEDEEDAVGVCWEEAAVEEY